MFLKILPFSLFKFYIKLGFIRESLGHSTLNIWMYFEYYKPKNWTVIIYKKENLHSFESFNLILNDLKKKYKIIPINTNLSNILIKIIY